MENLGQSDCRGVLHSASNTKGEPNIIVRLSLRKIGNFEILVLFYAHLGDPKSK